METVGFADYLRGLRERAGLTLRQVAELSRTNAGDLAGRISDGYLSSIEQGREVAVSAVKLATLAIIYGVSLDDIVGHAPASLQLRLRKEQQALPPESKLRLGRGRAAYMADRWRVDRDLYSQLAGSARNVAIPMGEETPAKELIEQTIIRATCLTVALPTLDRGVIDSFAERWPEPLEMLKREASRASVAAHYWAQLADVFYSFLLYELGVGDAAVAKVATWTVEFERALATCHFIDQYTESLHGYEHVPSTMVQIASTANVCGFLADRIAGLPRPESARAMAMRAYVKRLVAPAERTIQPASISGLVEAIADMGAIVSPGASPIEYDRRVHLAARVYLERLGDGGNPPETKGRQVKHGGRKRQKHT